MMLFLHLNLANLIKWIFALDITLNMLALTLSAAYSVNSCVFPRLIQFSLSDFH